MNWVACITGFAIGAAVGSPLGVFTARRRIRHRRQMQQKDVSQFLIDNFGTDDCPCRCPTCSGKGHCCFPPCWHILATTGGKNEQ